MHEKTVVKSNAASEFLPFKLPLKSNQKLVITQLQTQILQMIVSPTLPQHFRYMNMADENNPVLTGNDIQNLNCLFEKLYKPCIQSSHVSRKAFALKLAKFLADKHNITDQNFHTTSILKALKKEFHTLTVLPTTPHL